MWANEQAILTSGVTILCGIIAAAGQYKNWEIGVYAIAAGFITFILEYPRGKRRKGTSYQRKFQRPFAVIVAQGRFVTRNYFVRFVLYLILSVPCCFILPTLMGALCYMLCGLIYFVAAVKGEEWQPVLEVKSDQYGPEVIQEPSRPPPRRPAPVASAGDGSGDGNRV